MIDRDKLDELFDALANSALSLLEANGEFYPIGAVIAADRQIRFVQAHEGDEHPESQAVIDDLTKVFKGMVADEGILASAISFDARITSPDIGEAVDAIVTRIRAKDYARDVSIPYHLKTSGLFRKNRLLECGEPSASEGSQDIFI